MFQRTFLTGFAFALLATQACGSDDGKKHVAMDGAGMGGEAGQPSEPSAGGSSAGAPAGTAGEAPVPMGGTGNGGEPPVEPTAGAGGEPPIPVAPEPELLFSVKPGAVGLADTAISKATAKQNLIYTSSTANQRAIDGTNAVKITGESIGLDPLDEIVAFALPQAEPTSPMYLFSLADGSEGAYGSRAYEAYNNDGENEEGKLYYSDGVKSRRELGEDGDEYGYNGLLASEVSLGLARGNDSQPDDLTGLAVHDANEAITQLYFTVRGVGVGAVDSAVAGVAADERGCTVFKSELDGTNTVAFTCAELGLAATSQIDALAVYGNAEGVDDVVFSVTQGSAGAAGSALEGLDTYDVGAVLFRSSGDGSNTVLKLGQELGLDDHVADDFADDIDGLAIVDQTKASASHAGSCNLTYGPLDPDTGAALTTVDGVSHVGNFMLLFGQVGTQTARVVAYKATTCAFVQQRDLPFGFESSVTFAVVPVAGWSAAKPLDNVEYQRVEPDQAYGKQLSRYDAAGTLIKTLLIANTDYTNGIGGVLYDSAGDRLYLLLGAGSYPPQLQLTVLPRPTDATTTLSASEFHSITSPCAADATINGIDPAGNLYLAARQSVTTEYRVCGFTPTGELVPAPYPWTSNLDGRDGGFIVPGAAHFLLRKTEGPWVIERSAYHAP